MFCKCKHQENSGHVVLKSESLQVGDLTVNNNASRYCFIFVYYAKRSFL